MEEILNRATRLLKEHPFVITFGCCGTAMFLGYKLAEACIRNAVCKANIETVEYILKQVRYIQH